jgi:hypothetical protein
MDKEMDGLDKEHAPRWSTPSGPSFGWAWEPIDLSEEQVKAAIDQLRGYQRLVSLGVVAAGAAGLIAAARLLRR